MSVVQPLPSQGRGRADSFVDDRPWVNATPPGYGTQRVVGTGVKDERQCRRVLDDDSIAIGYRPAIALQEDQARAVAQPVAQYAIEDNGCVASYARRHPLRRFESHRAPERCRCRIPQNDDVCLTTREGRTLVPHATSIETGICHGMAQVQCALVATNGRLIEIGEADRHSTEVEVTPETVHRSVENVVSDTAQAVIVVVGPRPQTVLVELHHVTCDVPP